MNAAPASTTLKAAAGSSVVVSGVVVGLVVLGLISPGAVAG